MDQLTSKAAAGYEDEALPIAWAELTRADTNALYFWLGLVIGLCIGAVGGIVGFAYLLSR